MGMLHLSEDLRLRVSERLKPMVAAWTGIEAEMLETTATYGFRLYRQGASLRMHTDITETHALSVILEVGQLGFKVGDGAEDNSELDPWPLELETHDKELRVIPNRVGQAILYEGATCPHGRPRPFPGREY